MKGTTFSLFVLVCFFVYLNISITDDEGISGIVKGTGIAVLRGILAAPLAYDVGGRIAAFDPKDFGSSFTKALGSAVLGGIAMNVINSKIMGLDFIKDHAISAGAIGGFGGALGIVSNVFKKDILMDTSGQSGLLYGALFGGGASAAISSVGGFVNSFLITGGVAEQDFKDWFTAKGITQDDIQALWDFLSNSGAIENGKVSTEVIQLPQNIRKLQSDYEELLAKSSSSYMMKIMIVRTVIFGMAMGAFTNYYLSAALIKKALASHPPDGIQAHQ